MVLEAVALCSGISTYAVKSDIEENGWKNSTTRKVAQIAAPVYGIVSSICDDIEENGWKDSTTKKILNVVSPITNIFDE